MSTLDRRLVGLSHIQIFQLTAGANLDWPNPEDTRIKIVSVILTLTTSATAGNRRLTLEGHAGSFPFANSPAPGHQVASETLTYYFGTCVLGIDESDDLHTMWAVISPDMYLDPDDQLRTNILTLKSGDALSLITISYQMAQPI